MNKRMVEALLKKEASANKIDEMISHIKSKMSGLLDEYGHIPDIIYSSDFIEEYIRVFIDELEQYKDEELRNADSFYIKALDILKSFFLEEDCPKFNNTVKAANFLYEVGISPLSFCVDEIRNDFDIIQQAIIYTEGRAIVDLDSKYKDDRDFIAGWIAFYPRAYQFLNASLKDDFSLLELAIGSAPDLINYASERIRSDREMMQELIEQSPFSLFFMKDEFQNDLDLIKHAIEIDPSVYYYLSNDLKANNNIMSYHEARVAKYPFAYKVLIDPLPKPVFKKK